MQNCLCSYGVRYWQAKFPNWPLKIQRCASSPALHPYLLSASCCTTAAVAAVTAAAGSAFAPALQMNALVLTVASHPPLATQRTSNVESHCVAVQTEGSVAYLRGGRRLLNAAGSVSGRRI